MAIPITYTGQNSGAAPVMQPRPPSTAIRETVTNLQQQKRQDQALERAQEKDFLESMRVDPVSVANEKVMTQQAKGIEAFTTKGARIYQERKGRLTTQDKVQLQADKQALLANQAQLKGDYARYLQDLQNFNPLQHDSTHMQEMSQKYLESEDGRYTESILTPAAMDYQSYTDALYELADQPDWDEQIVGEREGAYTTAKVSPWEQDKAKRTYESFLMSSPTASKGLTKRFMASPQKENYLDAADINNDGVPNSKEWENAIIEFGWNEEASDIFLKQRGGKERRVSVSRSGGLTAAEKNAQLEERQNQPENLAKTGVSPKGDGYGWKPVDDGYAMVYGSKLSPDERTFEIPTDAIQADLPQGAAAINGAVSVKPTWISKDGSRVRMFVPVYDKEDMVDGWRRKRQLNRKFEGAGTATIVDGGSTYIKDEKGNIYRLGEDTSRKEIETSFTPMENYIAPYFDRIQSVFPLADAIRPKPTASGGESRQPIKL